LIQRLHNETSGPVEVVTVWKAEALRQTPTPLRILQLYLASEIAGWADDFRLNIKIGPTDKKLYRKIRGLVAAGQSADEILSQLSDAPLLIYLKRNFPFKLSRTAFVVSNDQPANFYLMFIFETMIP
jgi:hypothetical protein